MHKTAYRQIRVWKRITCLKSTLSFLSCSAFIPFLFQLWRLCDQSCARLFSPDFSDSKPDPAHCVLTCSTIPPSSHGISCQVLMYFPGMICYNGLAVDSFQQEGGEHNARSHRLYFFHHSKCNVTLHMQVAGWR